MMCGDIAGIEVGPESMHARAQPGGEGRDGGFGLGFHDEGGVHGLVVGAVGTEYAGQAPARLAGGAHVPGGGVTHRGRQWQREADLAQDAVFIRAAEHQASDRAKAPATPTTMASTTIFWRILRQSPLRPAC
jgi:hypothetical protein